MMTKILDFSRPLRPDKSRQNVEQVLKQTLAIVADLAQMKKITISSRAGQNLPLVIADPNLLKQALINLLKNAIEASPEGEEVEIRAYSSHQRMIIQVADHGEGLRPEVREEIFQPFFTTKYGGTGLGLPIVQKIVEAHQGQIEVLDNEKRGSIFRVSLPLAR